MPCKGHLASLAHALEHTKKELDIIDAENYEIDQIKLPLRYRR